MQVVIIGGGAGGASCAARLRRLDNSARIIILEKTAEISIASCGLPYYIGGVIANRDEMRVASPDFFKSMFNVDVRLNAEVVRINPEGKAVETAAGDKIPYDKLVIATGAKPFMPPMTGLDKIPHFTVKSLADADQIKAHVAEHHPRSVAVMGGGFIGIEVAENMVRLGLKTTVIDMADQVLAPLDKDMIGPIHTHLKSKGVSLILGDGVKECSEGAVLTAGGKKIPADMAVVAVGVRPDTRIAAAAGIDCLPGGAIRTNEFMQTSKADIYACGDNAAVRDFVSGADVAITLAGPANRQGRLIADHIAGAPYPYTGTQGTGIAKVFDMAAAFVGNNEKQLTAAKTPYHKMIIWGDSHAGYYPDATSMTLKVLYDDAGRILGAQAVGYEGVDKRVDVIATVMRLRGTTADLRDAELCYAPPYGSAKDPVNIMGMAIENARQGLVKPFFGTDFAGMFVIDVRPPQMYRRGHLPDAVNIPVSQLVQHLPELPRDKPILLHCNKGYTSYVAARILMANGFDNVFSYAGGVLQYNQEEKVVK